jgi:hypothetical protein
MTKYITTCLIFIQIIATAQNSTTDSTKINILNQATIITSSINRLVGSGVVLNANQLQKLNQNEHLH